MVGNRADAARRRAGQPASYDLFLSRLEPEDRARVENAIKQVAERGGGFDVSFRIAGTSDRGKWIRARAGLIRDDAGVARHLSGIFLDIDEEKQVEEALRTRETHLRSILHTIPDAMIVIDGRGIMQLFSTAAERLFGWSEQEAIGQNVSILMPEPDRTRHDSYIARYRSTNDPHIIGIGRIVTGKRRDGTTFPMHLSIGEMQSGGEPYFTGFVRDLTEHQKTQARLQELQSELVHVSRLTRDGRDGLRARPRDQPAPGGDQQLHEGIAAAARRQHRSQHGEDRERARSCRRNRRCAPARSSGACATSSPAANPRSGSRACRS